jgi:hypothetical protein
LSILVKVGKVSGNFTSDKVIMTHQEAQELLKKIIQAKDKDDLQQIVSTNVSRCDGVFFAELEGVVEQFQAQGDESSARKLKELGDFMARLRFMI